MPIKLKKKVKPKIKTKPIIKSKIKVKSKLKSKQKSKKIYRGGVSPPANRTTNSFRSVNRNDLENIDIERRRVSRQRSRNASNATDASLSSNESQVIGNSSSPSSNRQRYSTSSNSSLSSNRLRRLGQLGRLGRSMQAPSGMISPLLLANVPLLTPPRISPRRNTRILNTNSNSRNSNAPRASSFIENEYLTPPLRPLIPRRTAANTNIRSLTPSSHFLSDPSQISANSSTPPNSNSSISSLRYRVPLGRQLSTIFSESSPSRRNSINSNSRRNSINIRNSTRNSRLTNIIPSQSNSTNSSNGTPPARLSPLRRRRNNSPNTPPARFSPLRRNN